MKNEDVELQNVYMVLFRIKNADSKLHTNGGKHYKSVTSVV